LFQGLTIQCFFPDEHRGHALKVRALSGQRLFDLRVEIDGEVREIVGRLYI
jgi:hypothetical protein